ncbi:MAG: hypothetical protein WCV00_14765 [Verrucomicrobiia bacterium]
MAVALAAGAWQANAAGFPHEHRVGRIRVFFNTTGTNAVEAADVNHNGVPDQVEDVATQTRAAHMLFVETLGFPDPFKTERYRSAAFLDIHLLHKSVLRSNGVTYDELQHFRRPSDPPNTPTLCFNVATSVKPASNLTPAHEFFHVIQNSVTYFKNRWFTEGMARWSERALGLGGLGKVSYPGPWPPSEEKRAALFGTAYESSEHFWNGLAAMSDPTGQIPVDRLKDELKRLMYSNGARVLQDFQLTGWQLMRDVLLELDKADDIAFRELGYARWTEENQKSEKNNRYILNAAIKVAHRRESKSR